MCSWHRATLLSVKRPKSSAPELRHAPLPQTGPLGPRPCLSSGAAYSSRQSQHRRVMAHSRAEGLRAKCTPPLPPDAPPDTDGPTTLLHIWVNLHGY
ncbi:hypothetical protein AAFF_G00024190 [Aldrovandia affinis]|uniref:Uncharacterized protein n=1 Tax=Aldrovandia affinis TaxID=143900 RepID=A0AAD7WYZ1_9TELE|nr:hypothetical protein AAFF_G00024190 [Aldrovandia affinis]